MPPTSRGLLLLRLARPIPAPIKSSAQSRHVNTKLPANLPRAKGRAPEPELPKLQEKAPDVPFTAPRDAPPIGHRLYDRFGPLTRRTIRFLLLLVPWIPPILVLKMHFPLQILAIDGPSMQPLLNPNHTSEAGLLNTKDHVLVQRYISSPSSTSKKRDEIQRGQVIVFRAPHDPDKVVVKRVVGVPGDCITPSPRYPAGDTPVIIPWNHLWVEGDITDREKSVDSNWYGPISKSLIVGTVRAIMPYWPLPYPQVIDWESQRYPGEARVEKDAIRAIDPDVEERAAQYRPGRMAEQMIRQITENQGEMVNRVQNPLQREAFGALLGGAQAEAARGDPETKEIALALARELSKLLSTRVVTETQKNVSVTKEEFEAMKARGEIPDSILASMGRRAS